MPTPKQTPTPTIRARIAIAIAVAGLTAAYVVFAAHRQPHFVSDFDQLWYAARVLREGGDPYAMIGPGRAIDVQFPLYYPLTAVLIASPLSWLPIVVARVIWVALPAGVLSYLLTTHNYARLPLFLSGAFLTTALNAQWSVLLMCAALVPPLGGLVIGKPNMAPAVLGVAPARRTLLVAGVSAVVLIAASLLALPTWPSEWMATTRAATHFVPYVARGPLGWMLLLAALRWRLPEARLLLAFALVPHTAAPYEGVWAFLVTRTFRQALVIALLTHAVRYVILWRLAGPGFAPYVNASAEAMLVCVYLPCLWLVLRRPNEASSSAAVSAPAQPLAA